MITKKIYKYVLKEIDYTEVEMPVGSEILSIQECMGQICLWALVDPEAKKEYRCFEVFGTGYDVNYDMGISREYISTFQLIGGELVFHVFEYTGV